MTFETWYTEHLGITLEEAKSTPMWSMAQQAWTMSRQEALKETESTYISELRQNIRKIVEGPHVDA